MSSNRGFWDTDLGDLGKLLSEADSIGASMFGDLFNATFNLDERETATAMAIINKTPYPDYASTSPRLSEVESKVAKAMIATTAAMSGFGAAVSKFEESLKMKTITMGGESVTISKDDGISKEARVKAIDEFLKANIDMGRSLIRAGLLKSDIQKNVTIRQAVTLTVRDGANGSVTYSKVAHTAGAQINIRSFYVGKRGDVIFSFTRAGSINKQIEIKLFDAVKQLDGFFSAIVAMLGDKIDEMAAHHQKISDKMALEAKEAEQLKTKQAADAKAAKYAGKIAYGAW